jgi:hypothetical protein
LPISRFAASHSNKDQNERTHQLFLTFLHPGVTGESRAISMQRNQIPSMYPNFCPDFHTREVLKNESI